MLQTVPAKLRVYRSHTVSPCPERILVGRGSEDLSARRTRTSHSPLDTLFLRNHLEQYEPICSTRGHVRNNMRTTSVVLSVSSGRSYCLLATLSALFIRQIDLNFEGLRFLSWRIEFAGPHCIADGLPTFPPELPPHQQQYAAAYSLRVSCCSRSLYPDTI